MKQFDREQYLSKVIEIVNQTYLSFAELSINIPAPIRDQIFFSTLMNIFSGEFEHEHQARHCNACINAALSISLCALGWEDRNAPRSDSTTKRMEALLSQMEIALNFLDSMHHHG